MESLSLGGDNGRSVSHPCPTFGAEVVRTSESPSSGDPASRFFGLGITDMDDGDLSTASTSSSVRPPFCKQVARQTEASSLHKMRPNTTHKVKHEQRQNTIARVNLRTNKHTPDLDTPLRLQLRPMARPSGARWSGQGRPWNPSNSWIFSSAPCLAAQIGRRGAPPMMAARPRVANKQE